MPLARAGRPTRTARRGAAAVELAVVLPFLIFMVGVGVDFARVFYSSQTLANCARNGALYECDAYFRNESPYTNVTDAALADAPNLMADPNNKPTVTTATGLDASGSEYAEVTVRYKFRTVARFIGIPNEVELSRTVRMPRTPQNPDVY